ncbi:MAG: roadblock/LC7 domain-containing protein [Micromonosporaceae bacterium]
MTAETAPAGSSGPLGPVNGSDTAGALGATGGTGELNWLLDNFVRRVDQVDQAVILSRDGLTMAASHRMSREDAEHLSALAAGVQSLARGAGRQFNAGEVRQTIIEMEGALLFVTAAGQGSCLAVLSAADADVGLIAYEMALLVKRVGQHLTANARFPGHDEAAG